MKFADGQDHIITQVSSSTNDSNMSIISRDVKNNLDYHMLNTYQLDTDVKRKIILISLSLKLKKMKI
jgi:hypothetical protein